MIFTVNVQSRRGVMPDIGLESSVLAIRDIKLFVPKRHVDGRGWFCETWNCERYATHGVDVDFVQDNHSFSRYRGVLRGFHFQRPPLAQGKLVRVPRGRVLDVVVDIRSGSPTFGKSVAIQLSADEGQQLWVPPGFAHAFLTLSDNVDVVYKVTAPHSPDREAGIRWDDPALCIAWPLEPGRSPMLSSKDAALPLLHELDDLDELFPYGEY
jgi:dTDP-4-dehydrorhamnose 3,5-epimerase